MSTNMCTMNMKIEYEYEMYMCSQLVFEYYIGKMKWNEEMKGESNTKTTKSTKTTNY